MHMDDMVLVSIVRHDGHGGLAPRGVGPGCFDGCFVTDGAGLKMRQEIGVELLDTAPMPPAEWWKRNEAAGIGVVGA